MGLGDHCRLPGGGVDGDSFEFYAAIFITVTQTVVYDLKQTSALAFPVQIRFAYTVLLILCQVPSLGWLYWLPNCGNICPRSLRLLLDGSDSLTPVRTRTEPMSVDLILRTFLTPPDAYVLEGRIASLSGRTKAENKN